MNENISVGQMIEQAREAKGISKRELSRLAKISDTELARIESGEREIPNPKTLRKISKHIGINYNDLMYVAGLGFQVTKLNPFLRDYYEGLKGDEIDLALVNTTASVENWENLVTSFKEKLKDDTLPEYEREVIEQTIEDTEYQITTGKEIITLLVGAKKKWRLENNGK